MQYDLKDYLKKSYLALTPEMLRTPHQNSIQITYFSSERVEIIIHWTALMHKWSYRLYILFVFQNS